MSNPRHFLSLAATAICCLRWVGSPLVRADASETSLDRDGSLWAPFIEWSLDNATFAGNPFDLIATPTVTLGSTPYPHPEWIKTCSVFFQGRFAADMICDNGLTDGRCLKRPGKMHYLLYKEDTASVSLDLAEMSGAHRAVAVDTRKPYAELDVGQLEPSQQTWIAPYQSDWAIAVGHFESR